MGLSRRRWAAIAPRRTPRRRRLAKRGRIGSAERKPTVPSGGVRWRSAEGRKAAGEKLQSLQRRLSSERERLDAAVEAGRRVVGVRSARPRR